MRWYVKDTIIIIMRKIQQCFIIIIKQCLSNKFNIIACVWDTCLFLLSTFGHCNLGSMISILHFTVWHLLIVSLLFQMVINYYLWLSEIHAFLKIIMYKTIVSVVCLICLVSFQRNSSKKVIQKENVFWWAF